MCPRSAHPSRCPRWQGRSRCGPSRRSRGRLPWQASGTGCCSRWRCPRTGWQRCSRISARPGRPWRTRPPDGYRPPASPGRPGCRRCPQSRQTCCVQPAHPRPSGPSCNRLPDCAGPAAGQCRGSHPAGRCAPHNTCLWWRCGSGGSCRRRPDPAAAAVLPRSGPPPGQNSG